MIKLILAALVLSVSSVATAAPRTVDVAPVVVVADTSNRLASERVGTASPVRLAPAAAPRCTVRHTSFGPVRVCR